MKILFKLTVLSILLALATSGYADPVKVKIVFLNESNKDIAQTTEPYLDNYSSFIKADYSFLPPDKIIPLNRTSNADLSYEWQLDWYGGSQFAYNYAGRSKDYGCFVTELRFSGSWYNTRNYNVVIASYVKDPAYPNDYLTCTVEPVSYNYNTKFLIHLTPSANVDDKAKDDNERFTMAGDTSLLTNTTTYGIDLPITLNPKLTLYPDTAQPELTRKNFVAPKPLGDYATTIKVINHTNQTLEAGIPVLDRETRFSSNDFVDQPPEILPNETKIITVSSSAYDAHHMQRFNYHIKGYAKDSGCYISGELQELGVHNYYASFYFDQQHPKSDPNLYCAMTTNSYQDTVEIYDNFNADVFRRCNGSFKKDTGEDCISYSRYRGYTEFLDSLSLKTCNDSYSFKLDPRHTIQARRVGCSRPE